jgi:hypothetical protein
MHACRRRGAPAAAGMHALKSIASPRARADRDRYRSRSISIVRVRARER